MTEAGFKQIVNLLEGAFRTTLSKKERDAYWMLWLDQDDSAIMRAAVTYARDPKRARFGFPKPGDLLEATAADLDVLAEVALQHLIANNHASDSVTFDDRFIHAACERMGGWQACCDAVRRMEDREFSFWSRDWKTAYKALRQHPPTQLPERVIGYFELNNQERYPQHVPATRRVECAYIPEDERRALEAGRAPAQLPEALR